MSGSRSDTWLLALCLPLLGLAIIYPAVRLLIQAAHDWQRDAIFDGAGFAALRNTLVIALASVGTSGVLGTGIAFVLTRYTFRGRNLLTAAAYLPFALPPLVGVLSFYYLIGRDGLAPRLLEHLLGVHGITLTGPVAILLIHTYSFFVLFYATVSAALDSLDAAQIEAARNLGASRARVFFRVVAPALTPAWIGAALLTFMASVASFSAPYFFGQDFPMLSVRIYDARSQFHHAAAETMTVALAAVSLLGILAFRSRRRPTGSASKGAPRPIRRVRGGRLMTALLYAGTFVLLLPHVTIAWLSLVDHRAWGTEWIPTHFTLANFATLFQDPRSFAPIRNSLWMSALAAIFIAGVGLPAAYLIARRRRGGRLIHLLVLIPWALPGTVVAMNLIAAFNDPWLPLYNTIWLLPLAYFIRGLPLWSRMACAALETFDASLIEAGRTLGASRAFCYRRIAAPLLAPALVAATALVFATSLGEFVTSILLYMPDNLPIAVKINMEWRGSVGSAFAYSVLLMALVTVTFLASRRFTSRQI